jgi:hypothetical protein
VSITASLMNKKKGYVALAARNLSPSNDAIDAIKP